jgi:hypothetical protein
MGSLPAKVTVERRKIFVKALAEGKTGTQAAKLAGYTSPGTEAWRLMQMPDIVEAVRLATDSRTVGALPQAIGTLIELQSAKYPPAVRLAAAKTVIEQDRLDGKTLDKMTEAELLDVARKLQEQRQTLEDNAPIERPNDGQVIDM